MKRTRRDESIEVVMHLYMETTQGNFLCSYLYLKLAKTSRFSYCLLSFLYYKIREQEGRTGFAKLGWGEVGRGIRCKQCILTYVNAKMISVETVPGISGG
jgi:hypothetical protein